MERETSEQIEAMRRSFDEAIEQMTVEDFRRIHAKFFGCVLAVEAVFRRRYPKEWARYEQEFYGGLEAEAGKAQAQQERERMS